MDMVDLTPVEPAAGLPPWRDPVWLAEAVAWIDEQLAGAGLRRSGTPALRGRMWSVVARVPVGEEQTAWFKANPPGSAFEPGLIAALAQWAPDMVAPLVAVDIDRAWALTMDAGPRLAESLARDPDPAHLMPLLRRYARLQRELSARADELLALGLPDLRPATLPGRLKSLLADDALMGAVTERNREALNEFAVQARVLCRELDGFGIPASLDHCDLHPHNVFGSGEGALPFDWGDAALTHPFSTLLVLLRASRPYFDADALAGLRSAYLACWLDEGDEGLGLADLERATDLALRLAPVSRALAWARLFPCFAGVEEPNVNAARWLEQLLVADPLADFGAA
jgi:hypothetical protein